MHLLGYEEIPLYLDGDKKTRLLFWPQWLDSAAADELLQQAIDSIPWQSDVLKIAGKIIPVPRLHYWYGTSRDQYRWSGLSLTARPFPHWLDRIRLAVEQQCGTRFNRCLANYYRDGSDSMGWHSDDENELGQQPTIASLSFGDERRFLVREKGQRSSAMVLQHGSLLVMKGDSQRRFQHSLPKTRRAAGVRINLTYRMVRDQTAFDRSRRNGG